MGTRGTVEFYTSKEDLYNPATLLCTVYQHFDMYLEGFKEKLLAAINYQFNEQRQLSISFLITNPDSELTISSQYHGDLEYKYQIFDGSPYGKDSTISVYKWNFNEDCWKQIVDNEKIESFLNT